MDIPNVNITVSAGAVMNFYLSNNGSEQVAKLDQIAGSINQLKETVMASEADFKKGFERLNAATTKIAERLRKYTEQPLSGMTAEQEDAAQRELTGMVEALEKMGQDPANPVPVEPPTGDGGVGTVEKL